MTSYLVTGANRGLGLALVKQLASQSETLVFAAARNSSAELTKLAESSHDKVVLIEVEVTKPDSIAIAVKTIEKQLGNNGLDVLINNAGVQPFTSGGAPEMKDLNVALDVNVTSVHRMTAAFLPLLRKGQGKTVVNITSTLGSIAMASGYALAPTPEYKISKAALNMLTVQYAQELGKEGFIFLPISPGWLKTDMGSSAADLPVEVGAQSVLDIVRSADSTFNGKFQNIKVPGWENVEGPNVYDGKNPPW